jgi:hypothetical protein
MTADRVTTTTHVNNAVAVIPLIPFYNVVMRVTCSTHSFNLPIELIEGALMPTITSMLIPLLTAGA